MAFRKTSSALVRDPNVQPGTWKSRVASSRQKYASSVLSQYSPDKWLLSHVSIMASVDVEPDFPGQPTKNFRIIPEHSFLVNNNGDAWERELLMKTYKTFIGANNYCEHVQIPELSKGKVVDAALRVVDLAPSTKADGTQLTAQYVDLLVATSWENDDLCRKILSGEFNAMSMGCFAPGTLITMGDRTKKNITDVLPGDYVVTHTGNIAPVKNTQIRHKDEVILGVYILGRERPTYVTTEHPYFAIDIETAVENKGGYVKPLWTPASELGLGYFVTLPVVPADVTDSWEFLDKETVVSWFDGAEDRAESFVANTLKNGYLLKQVDHVEDRHYVGQVFNFEVEGDNSYIANDVAVHNCLIQYSQCTKCGNIAKDETELCEHVRFYKNTFYYDRDGKQRVIAELCGSADDPKSVTFIDASWVRNPAFPGAVLRNIISPPTAEHPHPRLSPVEAAGTPKAPDMLLKGLKDRVTTDTSHHAIPKEAATKMRNVSADDLNALDKLSHTVFAAAEDADRFGLGDAKPEEPPADAPADPPAPEGGDTAFPEETPPGDAGSDPLADMAGGDPAGAPAADAPPAGATPETQATPLDDVKKQVTDTLLNQIKQDLIDSAKKMTGDTGAGADPRVFQDSFDENESLMRQASGIASYENSHRLWNKYSIDIQTVQSRRVASALLVAARYPLAKLASFGFTKSDVLDMLSYVDRRTGSAGALGGDTLGYMRKRAGYVGPRNEYFRDLIITTGRKPCASEAAKINAWMDILGGL